MDDLISRQAAIEALWKALFEYEEKTEKQFLTSDDFSVYDWFQDRIFVQNMSDIDRRVIIDLPTADVKPIINPYNNHPICPFCGRDLKGVIKDDG